MLKSGKPDSGIVEMCAAETSWEGKPAFIVNPGDISARWHDDQRLRESEAKYRMLFETMSQGVVYQNAKGEITTANPAAERILGLTLAEMQGLTFMDPRWRPIHQDGSDFPGDEHPAMVALKTGRVVSDVIMGVYNHIDQAHRWISVTAIPHFRTSGDRPYEVHATFEDMTARKKAFDQAQYLAAIVHSTDDAVISKTLDGTITSWNPGAEHMYGYSAEEAVGQNMSLLVPDDLENDLVMILDRVRRGVGIDSYETVRCRKNGEQICVSLTVSPIRDEAGRIVGASSIARDASQQHRARLQIEEKTRQLEKALLETKKREDETRALLSGARAALESQSFGSAARRIFDACCKATGAVAGYVALISADGSEDEVLFLEPGGQACEVNPDLAKHVRGLRGKAYSRGQVVWRNDFMASKWAKYLPPGHVQLRNVLLAPLTLTDSVIGVLGLANKPCDFTPQDAELAGAFGNLAAIALQRSRAEQLLGESEKKYRFLADTTVDCIWMMDMNLRFTYVNPAVERIFGFSPQEYVGTCLSDHCSDEHLIEIRRLLEETLSTPPRLNGVTFETCLKHRDGHNVPIEVAGRIVYDQQGVRVAIQGTAKDITERKLAEAENERLQQQVQQSQKLESIGQLAGGVAHDFNNMLSLIIGYGEDILSKLHQADPLRESAKEIVTAGKRSGELTRQLLAFSRKQTLQPQVLDINYLISNLEKMLCRLIGDDIELETMLADELSPVEVDPGQIEQVIMNIAVNARDAMPQGGKLIIETANAELDEEYASHHVGVVPGEYVMLSISDTGCGMDEVTAKRIFEPFFTTKEKGKGTGLGLSTVYGIVKQSKGNLWVYSEPDRGSTFKIYLPCTTAEIGTKKAQINYSRIEGRKEKLLIVDDEPALRKLCETVLRQLKYEVIAAANGEEALLLVEESKIVPDLIITDVVMPRMSGKILVDRLKGMLPDLKVLYMSGYTDNAIVHHGLLDSDAPFIQKPFNIVDLSKKVREVLDEGRQLGRGTEDVKLN